MLFFFLSGFNLKFSMFNDRAAVVECCRHLFTSQFGILIKYALNRTDFSYLIYNNGDWNTRIFEHGFTVANFWINSYMLIHQLFLFCNQTVRSCCDWL